MKPRLPKGGANVYLFLGDKWSVQRFFGVATYNL